MEQPTPVREALAAISRLSGEAHDSLARYQRATSDRVNASERSRAHLAAAFEEALLAHKALVKKNEKLQSEVAYYQQNIRVLISQTKELEKEKQEMSEIRALALSHANRCITIQSMRITQLQARLDQLGTGSARPSAFLLTSGPDRGQGSGCEDTDEETDTTEGHCGQDWADMPEWRQSASSKK